MHMPIQERALLNLQQDRERAAAEAKGAQEAAELAQQRLIQLEEQQRHVEGKLEEATASHDRLKRQQAQVHYRPSAAGDHRIYDSSPTCLTGADVERSTCQFLLFSAFCPVTCVTSQVLGRQGRKVG